MIFRSYQYANLLAWLDPLDDEAVELVAGIEEVGMVAEVWHSPRLLGNLPEGVDYSYMARTLAMRSITII